MNKLFNLGGKNVFSVLTAFCLFFSVNLNAKNAVNNFRLPNATLTKSDVTPTIYYAGGSGTLTKTSNFSAFSTCFGSASTAQSFTISATALNSSSTVNLTAPTGFEISATSTGTYSTSLIVSQTSSGTVSTTTLYLRLSASATAGTYSGTLLIASDGAATDLSVALPSSTVNAIPSITGTLTTVIGGTSTLSSTISGGTWSSSATSIATIGSSTGIVTGVANGSSTITYTTSAGCANTVSFTVSGPSITKTGTLNAFATCIGTASTSQTFTVTGNSLTNNITITPPTGFELSIVSGGTYTSSLTLIASSGSVTNTTIYIRLMASATAGTYSGSISISSTGATSQTITIPSSSVNTIPTITQGSGSTLTGTVGSTTTITGSGTPALSGTWSSSNTSVATITGNNSTSGSVTGVANGITKITYTNNNGCSVSSILRVGTNSVTWYVTNTSEATLNPDATFANISTAINKALSGDRVIVYEGTYNERIDYGSKSLTIASRYLLDLDTTHISRTKIDATGIAQNNDWNSPIINQANYTSDTSTQKFIGFKVINSQGFTMQFNGGVIRNNIFASNITRGYDVTVLRAIGAKIENNTFDGNKGLANIYAAPFNQGDHVWTYINANTFKNQVLTTNDQNQGLILTSNQKVKITNNLFYNNKSPNIISVGGNDQDNVLVLNNTFVNNSSNNTNWNSYLYNVRTWENTAGFLNNITNNIILNSGSIRSNNNRAVDFNVSNNYTSNALNNLPEGFNVNGNYYQKNNYLADYSIKFVDSANKDFRLDPTSFGIGYGLDTTIVVNKDFNNNARPLPSGTKPDIGAFENEIGIPQPILNVTAGQKRNYLRWDIVKVPYVDSVLIYRSTDSLGTTVAYSKIGTKFNDTAVSNKIMGSTKAPSNTNDYTYIGAYGGSTYYISKTTANWTDAKNLAEAQGGQLVCIETPEENNYINSARQSIYTGSFIAGGYQVDKQNEPKGSWYWVNGKPMTMDMTGTNFGPTSGEPNNSGGSEDYLVVYNGGNWNDIPVGSQDRYIIEFDGSVGSVKIENYIDSANISNGTKYFYKIQTTDKVNNSNYSLIKSATPNVGAKLPTSLTVQAASNAVKISWTNPTGQVAGKYVIYHSTDSFATNNTVVDTVVNTLSFVKDEKLLTGKTYFYRIKAIDQNGIESEYSNTVSVKVTSLIFIDPNGNDANFGSETAPFKTLGAAVDFAQPRDTIVFNNGTHTNAASVAIQKNIFITSKYFFTKDSTDLKATILTGGTDFILMNISNTDTVKIHGLTIQNHGNIAISTNSTRVVITSCIFKNNGNSTTQNAFLNLNYGSRVSNSTFDSNNGYISLSNRDIVIDANKFFNNKFGASNVNYLFQGWVGKFTISNNLFVQNGSLSKDNWGGTVSSIINTGGWDDTTFVVNNTFLNNNANAIQFAMNNNRKSVVLNNLIFNPAGDFNFQKPQYSTTDIPGATLIYANTISQDITAYNNYKTFSVKADNNITLPVTGMIDNSTYKIKSNFIGIGEGLSTLKTTNGTVFYTAPKIDLYGNQRTGQIDIGSEQSNFSIPAPIIDNIEAGSGKNLIIIKAPFNKNKVKTFKIYTSTNSIADTATTAKLLATITDTLRYLDTTVVNGSKYYYRVKALDTSATQSSEFSNEIAVTPNVPPAKVDSLLISVAPRSALLKWGKQASGIKYFVLGGTNVDSLNVIANKLDTNIYVVKNLIKDKNYWFAVKAIDSGGATSLISNVVKLTPTNTWHIDTVANAVNLGSPEYPFNNIQNVIDTSMSGDTLLLHNGTYAENLKLFSKTLIIKAQNIGKAIIDPVDSRTKSTLNIQDIAQCCYDGVDYTKPRNKIIGLVFTGNTSMDWSNSDAPSVLNITNNSNPLFESCIFRNNSSQYFARFDRSAPAFNNCLIINNTGQSGLFQIGYEDTTLPRTNIPRFANCVFDNNSYFSRYGSTINGIAIMNSIISNNGYDNSFSETNFRIANSIVDNNKLASRSSTNLLADPQFNDPASFDYSLSNVSPALGRGGTDLIITGSRSVDTVRALEYDFNYNKRPNPTGTNSDLGAFENKYSISSPLISRLERTGTSITLTWEKPNASVSYSTLKVYRDTLQSALDTVAALNINVDLNKSTIADELPSNKVYYYALKASSGSGSNIVNTGLSNIKSTLDTVFVPNLVFAADTASIQLRAAARQGSSFGQMTHLVKLASDDAAALPKFIVYSQEWKQIDSTKALTSDSLTVININKQTSGTNSIKLSYNKSVLLAKGKSDYLQIISAMNVNNDDEFDFVGIYRKGTDLGQQSRIAYLTNNNLNFKLDTTNVPANFYNPNINSWNQTTNLAYKWDQKTFQHNDGAVNFGQNIESSAEFMDANFDGKQELVATLHQVKWEPNAQLNFNNSTSISQINSSVRPIKYIDVNNDGIPDIFAMTNWSWSVGLSQANGNPLVAFISNKKDGKFYMYMTGLNIDWGANIFFGDFSNDRKVQIMTRVNGGNYRVYNFDNNYNAVSSPMQVNASLNDGRFDVADINNDSYPDIITVDNSGNFIAYINNHASSFTKKIIGATPFTTNQVWSIFNLKVMDVNRDGFKDLIWYEMVPDQNGSVQWNSNNFTLRTWLQTPGAIVRTAPPAITAESLKVSNDGYKIKVKWTSPKDAIDNYLFANVKVDTTSNFKSARINNAYNYRSSNPTIPIILDRVFARNYPDSLEFNDINLSSKKPYYVAVQMVNKEGQSSQFTSTSFVPKDPLNAVDNVIPGLYGARFTWGDYNKDGLMDLAVLGQSDNGNVTNVFQNTGTGFVNLNLGIRPFRYGDIKWVDLNNDGWLDIAIIGQPGGVGVSFQTLINNKGVFEINTPSTVNGLKYSNMAFGDYDNNGTLDMFTSGQDALGVARSYLYTNDGKGNFTIVPEFNSLNVVPNMYNADAKFVDYDLDGDLDLVYAGTDQSNSPAGGVRVNTILDPKLTSNNYGGSYNNGYTYNLSSYNNDCQCSIGLSMNNARFDIGDIDGDGDMDIVEIGTNRKSTGTGFTTLPQLVIIRNQTVENKNAKYGNYFSYGNIYNTSVLVLDSISDGDIKLVDFNNDGLLDITVTGLDQKSNAVTKFYLNEGGFGNFTLSNNNSIAQYSSSAISWGDANGDGDMDLVLSGLKNTGGSSTSIYMNSQGANVNKAPTAPKNLRFIDQGQGRILLQWDAAEDDHTISSNLYYNLKLGTKPGLSDLRVIQVNENNGKLLTPNTSLIGTNQYYIELPPGVYFWSVQAIDGNYTSSSFAPNQKIVLKYPWQFVNQGGIVDSRILPLENPAFAWADVNNKGVFDFLYLGTGNNANNYSNTPVGLYRNMGGKFAKLKNDSTQSSLAGTGTGFNNMLNGISNAKIKWIDLNNDGYVDLVVAGNDVNSGQGRLVVFRNKGNYKFEEITNQIYSGVKLSSPNIEFVDLDNNGLKDFVYTGLDLEGIGQFKFLGFYKDSTVRSNSGAVLGFKVNAINCNLDALLASKQISNVSLGIGDLNKDLKPDLAIIYDDGYNANRVGSVYMNNSDTTTTNTYNLSFALNNTISLPTFRNATLDLIDNNNDGLLDLAISGRSDADGQVFRIYQNKWIDSTKKTIQFVQTNSNVKPFEKGQTTWGDINADGYPDVIFNGTRTGVGAISAMALADPSSLQVNGVMKYNELPTFPFGNYTTLRPSLGDFSGRKVLDLVLVGNEKITDPTNNTTSTVSSFKILKNVRDISAAVLDTIVSFGSNNIVNESVIKSMSVSSSNNSSNITKADFVNSVRGFAVDSSIAVVDSNYVETVYKANASPSSPVLDSSVIVSKVDTKFLVKLSWKAAKDDKTPSSGLTYAVGIGTEPGKVDILDPNADLKTGIRKTPDIGNAGNNTSMTVLLSPGVYYYTTQSIDAANAGSSFSPIKTIQVNATRSLVERSAPYNILLNNSTDTVFYLKQNDTTGVKFKVTAYHADSTAKLKYSIISDASFVSDTAFFKLDTINNLVQLKSLPTKNTYKLKLRVTDNYGAYFDKAFSFQVFVAPSSILVNEKDTSLLYFTKANADSAKFSIALKAFYKVDPTNFTPILTYGKATGANSDNNDLFELVNSVLINKRKLDDADTIRLKVNVTDQYGLSVERVIKLINLDCTTKPSFTFKSSAVACLPNTVNLTDTTFISNASAALTYTYFSDINTINKVAQPNTVGASGTYYVKGTTAAGCAVVRNIVVTVSAKPANPVVSVAATCQNDKPTIVYTAPNANTKLVWYGNNATGGTGSTVTPTFNTSAAGTQSYYVAQADTVAGCYGDRVKLDLLIKPSPAAPVLSRDTAGYLVSNVSKNNTWYKDNAKVDSSGTDKFKPAVPGSYTVKVLENGCFSAMSAAYYFIVTDIINLGNNEFIKITPNPFVNYLNFDYKVAGYQYLNVEFFDMTNGQRVMIKERVLPGSILNVGSLVPGTYLIRVVSNDYKLKQQFKMIKM